MESILCQLTHFPTSNKFYTIRRPCHACLRLLVLITRFPLSDCRHSCADKPYLNMPQKQARERAPVVDLTHINPTLQKYHSAHLRGRHGIVDYQNPPPERVQPMFWTLPKRSNPETHLPRSKTYEQRTDYFAPKPNILPEPVRQHSATIARANSNTDCIRISPIDPRSTGAFKSSTPSNKESVVDLTSKLLSPVKSTMTNEELYAVIHKSKKKLNIKDPERAASPALSTISLSPVNSESSLYGKGTQRHPETGYLGDPRTRNSWSHVDQPGLPIHSQAANRFQKPETTCADRFGPAPHTSRLDFKRLLLQHSVKLNTLAPQTKSNKLSAVEQLKLSRDKAPSPVANKSQINILDLSGSPKTYTHRKVMKPVPQPASPVRTNTLIKEHKSSAKTLLSPKSQWRFSSPRSDVLSSPIPEANNEDDTSNSSGEKRDVSPQAVSVNSSHHFGARRNLIPINENLFERDTDSPESLDQGVFPLHIECSTAHGLSAPSRAEMLQARRAQFFSSPPESSPPTLSTFRRPSSGTPSRTNTSPERIPSPSTLETAL